MLPPQQKKLVSIAVTFLLFFFLLTISSQQSKSFCSGSFNSISFTFNDMIIHISRLFQIITAFQSLFTPLPLPPPNVLPRSTCFVPFFLPPPYTPSTPASAKLSYFLMAIIENAFHQKQHIIICRRDRRKEMIEQFSKWFRGE